MIKRDFLKFLGAGLASLPFAGKLFREGAPEIKAATKGIMRALPKIEGMPEWFSPLVNKIMKTGKDISPEAKRVEDMTIVKTIKDGDTHLTIEENKINGVIDLHIESPRNPHGEPVTLRYQHPKTDIDPTTGKKIYEPGKFKVIESEPQWTGHWEDPTLELGERFTTIDQAVGDIEAAERAVTGKIKNREKIKERRAKKDYMENSPGDYLESEYGPGDYKSYDDIDFANGGIASFANGGHISKGSPVRTDLTKTIPPVKGPNSQGVETLFKKRYK